MVTQLKRADGRHVKDAGTQGPSIWDHKWVTNRGDRSLLSELPNKKQDPSMDKIISVDCKTKGPPDQG